MRIFASPNIEVKLAKIDLKWILLSFPGNRLVRFVIFFHKEKRLELIKSPTNLFAFVETSQFPSQSVSLSGRLSTT